MEIEGNRVEIANATVSQAQRFYEMASEKFRRICSRKEAKRFMPSGVSVPHTYEKTEHRGIYKNYGSVPPTSMSPTDTQSS